MKHPVDLARRFLVVADRDIKTLHLLIAASDSDDQAVGFHAQQAIEKWLRMSGLGLKLKSRPPSGPTPPNHLRD
ncbi:MAG TPA: hypothetical protein VGK48_14740 [Terriglobia bacterium]|jgi:hypothetical protein